MPQLYDIIFVLLAWLILVGFVWVTTLFFLAYRDRRPKHGVRCRKCFYNLYRIEHNTCPECGADLSSTGVWSHAQPKRSGIVHIMSMIGWVVYVSIALVIQLSAEISIRVGLPMRVVEIVAIILFCTGWLIPLLAGLLLRAHRNRKAILPWPTDKSQIDYAAQ